VTARADYSRLGYVQHGALTRLAACPSGLTTEDLEDLSDGLTPGVRRSCIANAMRLLKDRGLAVVVRRVPPASVNGRGAWRNVWAATDEGRDLVRRTT